MSETMEIQDFNPLKEIISQQLETIHGLEEENETLTEEVSNLTDRVQELETDLLDAINDRDDRDTALRNISRLAEQYV